jgi:hypothetical protein
LFDPDILELKVLLLDQILDRDRRLMVDHIVAAHRGHLLSPSMAGASSPRAASPAAAAPRQRWL